MNGVAMHKGHTYIHTYILGMSRVPEPEFGTTRSFSDTRTRTRTRKCENLIPEPEKCENLIPEPENEKT